MIDQEKTKEGVTVIVNTGQPEVDYIQKIVEYCIRKFMQKKGTAPEEPQTSDSPLTTEPMGPIDNGVPEGATRAPNKSINDFTNF